MDGNISGGNFLGGIFPGDNFPRTVHNIYFLKNEGVNWVLRPFFTKRKID